MAENQVGASSIWDEFNRIVIVGIDNHSPDTPKHTRRSVAGHLEPQFEALAHPTNCRVLDRH